MSEVSTVESNVPALPDPQPVHIYQFTTTNGLIGEVLVFPKSGDTVERIDGDWVFTFPRLNEEETVFKHTVSRLKVIKTERRVMSHEDMVKEVARRKKVKAEAEKAARELL